MPGQCRPDPPAAASTLVGQGVEHSLPGYFSPARSSNPRGETQPVFDWADIVKASTPKSSWTPQEALYAVLFSATVCDGGLERVEQETLLVLIHRSRALKALRDEELENLNASVGSRSTHQRSAMLSDRPR